MDPTQRASIADTTEHPSPAEPSGEDAVIESDSLIEEISIDGMCGVY